MRAAFYLLVIAGAVGSYDVLYYHMYKLRLYRHHDALWENLTHSIRAFLFAAMMITVIHLRCAGAWWLLYPLLLGAEVVNTMSDTILEPRSRRSMGGLPHLEYVLHVFLSIVTGAALASMIWGSFPLLLEPAAISWQQVAVPLWIRLAAYGSVAISLGMFLFELVGVSRLLAAEHARAH